MSLADRLPDPGEGYLNRIDELTRQRDELAGRVGKLSTRAHYADLYASVVEEENAALEVKVRALEEANDALRFQLPTYGSKVERWLRGEADCL